MKSIFLMYLKNSLSGLLIVLFANACTDKSKRMTFNERIDVEPSTWIESNVIQSPLSDSIVVNNGEYSVNSGNWIQGKSSISEGDKIKVRVMSSKLPNDVTMCEIILGNDSIYFQVTTKNFTATAKQGDARNINLGISGPNNTAIGVRAHNG